MLSTTNRPFFRESFIPTALRDSILTLLGPIPNLKVSPRPAWKESLDGVHTQRLALSAYRARVVALIDILEVCVTAENVPAMGAPERDTSAPRKPIAAAEKPSALKITAT